MNNKNKLPQTLEEETAVHFGSSNNLLWLEKHRFYYRNFCNFSLMFEFMLLPSAYNNSNFFVLLVNVACLFVMLYLVFN